MSIAGDKLKSRLPFKLGIDCFQDSRDIFVLVARRTRGQMRAVFLATKSHFLDEFTDNNDVKWPKAIKTCTKWKLLTKLKCMMAYHREMIFGHRQCRSFLLKVVTSGVAVLSEQT